MSKRGNFKKNMELKKIYLFIIVILFLSSVLPFVLAISGSETALIGFALIVLSRVVSSLRTGALPNTALLHPFAILILF